MNRPAPDTPSAAADAWVPLAVFAAPHGVSGRIKVKSLTDTPDGFAAHKNLTDSQGNPIKLRITGHAQGMAIAAVEGITNRDQAERLRGRKIGIPQSALPALDSPNRYYIRDLVGMAVTTTDGTPFGTVSNVMNYGASDILEITRENGSETELYAFTHRTFPEVDVDKRHITINPPEILTATPE